MARVTVEDCLSNLENRFELVRVASKRARQLALGSPAKLEWENDKPTVMALREIAEELVDASVLNEDDVPRSEAELSEEEQAAAATMSSEAEAEVGVAAAQTDDSSAPGADGEIDVAAALAAALAADLGGAMNGMMSDAAAPDEATSTEADVASGTDSTTDESGSAENT